jgi:hypothetical protein
MLWAMEDTVEYVMCVFLAWFAGLVVCSMWDFFSGAEL